MLSEPDQEVRAEWRTDARGWGGEVGGCGQSVLSEPNQEVRAEEQGCGAGADRVC